MNLKRIGILAYAACFFAVVAFPLSAQQYEIVDLGTLGGARSGVHSINENGIISGWATLPSGGTPPVKSQLTLKETHSLIKGSCGKTVRGLQLECYRDLAIASQGISMRPGVS
jgi:hypothetical protein